MKRFWRVLTLVAFLAVLAGGAWMGISLIQLLKGRAPRIHSTATILQQVQTVSELVTVKYVMEKVVVLEDVKWYGESRVLLVAHGIVKGGVNLSQIQDSDIQTNGQKITIRLPRPQITDCYLDENQTYVIERSTGLLRTFDKNLEQSARQNAVDDIRRAARQSGILKDANDRAKWQLRVLFQQMGYVEVEFTER